MGRLGSDVGRKWTGLGDGDVEVKGDAQCSGLGTRGNGVIICETE